MVSLSRFDKLSMTDNVRGFAVCRSPFDFAHYVRSAQGDKVGSSASLNYVVMVSLSRFDKLSMTDNVRSFAL
jgi:hypothetical protein